MSRARAASQPQVVTSGRPMNKVALLLEERYAEAVTYEDPIYLWEGDAEASAKARGLYPKERSFVLPFELRPDRTAIPGVASLRRILGEALAAYHEQTDGPRFEILTSRWGLHIVPVKARDATGQLVQVMPLLNCIIDVPVASRLPSAHFEAICEAVTKVGGVTIKANSPWLDQYFLPNGQQPPRYAWTLADKDKEKFCFAWGVTRMMARDALIGLIEPSATTLKWQLLCNPEPWDRNCVLNLSPIQVIAGGPEDSPAKKAKIYDRCKKCPPQE
jgi:hypothetical protein